MKNKLKIIFFTGAGVSAESGLKTFRDADGLWENHRIEDVATPEGWERNRKMVLEFYNQRRVQALGAKPNKAHLAIAKVENDFDVQVITQNVDDLHERAGSTKVLHLHGELMKARSTTDASLIYNLKEPMLSEGDLCEKGSQLRPHIVWFGEEVPAMHTAVSIAFEADILVVVGTSLNVYPAASIAYATNKVCVKYLVDPGSFDMDQLKGFQHLKKNAAEGLPELVGKLKNLYLKSQSLE